MPFGVQIFRNQKMYVSSSLAPDQFSVLVEKTTCKHYLYSIKVSNVITYGYKMYRLVINTENQSAAIVLKCQHFLTQLKTGIGEKLIRRIPQIKGFMVPHSLKWQSLRICFSCEIKITTMQISLCLRMHTRKMSCLYQNYCNEKTVLKISQRERYLLSQDYRIRVFL